MRKNELVILKYTIFLSSVHWERYRSNDTPTAINIPNIQIFLFLFIFKDFIYSFLERGEDKERNINVQVPLMHPILATWPTTQACALTRNQTGDSLVHSPHSIHWATPARAHPDIFKYHSPLEEIRALGTNSWIQGGARERTRGTWNIL